PCAQALFAAAGDAAAAQAGGTHRGPFHLPAAVLNHSPEIVIAARQPVFGADQLALLALIAVIGDIDCSPVSAGCVTALPGRRRVAECGAPGAEARRCAGPCAE